VVNSIESTKAGIVTSQPGAAHLPLYMVRQVKIYPIQENELNSLALLSNVFTGVMTIAGGVVGFLVSILWDMATSPEESKRTIGMPVAIVCVVVILACGAIAIWSRQNRGSELARILSESRSLGGSV
jgi:hypothetical protein